MKNKNIISTVICILFLTGSYANSLYAQANFKILSYNILMGLQNDSINKKDYINWVKGIDPDIVAYQEMNTFTQKSIEEFAARYGHPYAVISKTEGFPVALTSKYPIVNVQKVVDNMHHAYLVANIRGINIIVIHFSPFSYQKRNLEVKEILARAALFPQNEKIAIMGDFNSLSPLDAVIYNEEYLKSLRENELKDKRRQNLNNGQIDYEVIRSILNAGYKDAVRMFHSEFQGSIPTKKYGTNFPKRIDFMFLNPKFAKDAVSADIQYHDVTDRISDHYPVLVTFKLK